MDTKTSLGSEGNIMKLIFSEKFTGYRQPEIMIKQISGKFTNKESEMMK
jgi:hypothetical protein